jgi:nicotinate dehydrogenase subunit B
MQNTFANECFMDELAAAAGADPIEFRLRYLDPSDRRGIEALERVAALAKWEKRPAPKGAQSGEVVTGRGVSYCKYELVRTYIAAVAEVEVRRSTGEIRATRFYVAHDCGQIINPDGIRNQIEGNVIQTLSRTLKEELKFDRSRVTSLDWASYPILTFPEVPDIVMDLIDRPVAGRRNARLPSGSVRRKLEATAEIPRLEKTTGRDGRSRPATTSRAPSQKAGGIAGRTVTAEVDPAASAERRRRHRRHLSRQRR